MIGVGMFGVAKLNRLDRYVCERVVGKGKGE
jgi:hypothetical protein